MALRVLTVSPHRIPSFKAPTDLSFLKSPVGQQILSHAHIGLVHKIQFYLTLLAVPTEIWYEFTSPILICLFYKESTFPSTDTAPIKQIRRQFPKKMQLQ